MKEYKIDKKIADKIAEYLHPNQIKHLSLHKIDFNKYLVIDQGRVKIVVKSIDSVTGEQKETYSVYMPEIQKITEWLEKQKI